MYVMASTGDRIRRLRERIENGELGHPDDKEFLLGFSDRLWDAQPGVSKDRHEKLLSHAAQMSEGAGPIHPIVEDEDTARRVRRWVLSEYENPHTERDCRLAMRKMGRLMTPGDGLPESIAWVPGGISKDYDPVPDREEMIEWEEAEAMADAARNARDAALVMVQMEAGLRSSELHNLTLADIKEGQEAVRLRVHGAKNTGTRHVPLIRSISYLNRWLSEHPRSEEPSAPLWCNLDTGGEISYRSFNSAFKRAADRANIPDVRDVTPTGLRKANTLWLVLGGMNAPAIHDRQGRSQDSDAVKHYIAKFQGDDAEEVFLDFLGMSEDGAPTCPRCEANIAETDDRCARCGFRLDLHQLEGTLVSQLTHEQIASLTERYGGWGELVKAVARMVKNGEAPEQLLEDDGRRMTLRDDPFSEYEPLFPEFRDD